VIKEEPKNAFRKAYATIIDALKAHDQVSAKRQEKAQARAERMKRLHKLHISAPMMRMTPQMRSASAPLAGFLVDWVTKFERDGLRTEIWKRFGIVHLPIARGTMKVETNEGAIKVDSELMIVVHSWATESGFYRYRESIDGNVAYSSDDNLEDADDLVVEIHPELLKQFHLEVSTGKAWWNIETWIRAKTEEALKDR
jgi:hypothetical protein